MADYTKLLTNYIRTNPTWYDLLRIATEVFDEEVNGAINQLQNIRDPDAVDRLTKIALAHMLGFDYNSDAITDEEFTRLTRFMSQFNLEKGKQTFMDFIGYVKNTRFSIHPLWASIAVDNTYEQFVSDLHGKANSLLDNTGTAEFFPTTHVGISFDALNFPIDEQSQADIRNIFYHIAPINLVLAWLAASYDFPSVKLLFTPIDTHTHVVIEHTGYPLDSNILLTPGVWTKELVTLQANAIVYDASQNLLAPVNFTNAALTRNTPGWYFDSSLAIQRVGSDALRMTYGNTSSVRKGVWVEAAATNKMISSDDFTGTGWGSNGTITVAANTITDTDGSTLSSRYQTVTITNDSAWWTFSTYVQKNATNIVGIQVQMYGGTALNYGLAIDTATGNANRASTLGLTPPIYDVVSFGNYWRVSIAVQNNASGNTTLRVDYAPAYATSLGVGSTSGSTSLTTAASFRWSQIESGIGATSPIVTTTDPTLRSADLWKIDPALWAYDNQFLFAMHVTWDTLPRGNAGIFNLINLSGNKNIRCFFDSATSRIRVIIISGGLTAPIQSTTVISAGGTYKIGLIWDKGVGSLYINGVLEAQTFPGYDLTGLQTLTLGSDVGTYLNGYIKKIHAWGLNNTASLAVSLTS